MPGNSLQEMIFFENHSALSMRDEMEREGERKNCIKSEFYDTHVSLFAIFLCQSQIIENVHRFSSLLIAISVMNFER